MMNSLHVFDIFFTFSVSAQAEACELETAQKRGLFSTDGDLSDDIVRAETISIVRRAVARLRPTERRVVIGTLAGLPPEEIARRCEISTERVKIVWKQSTLKLRRELEPLL
jgi:DNA-directed RNA polymerase specialized sigma24 family protein